MFAKSFFFAASLSILAAAAPSADVSQCSTGSAQCCNSVQPANSPSISSLLALLGISAGNVTGEVGLGCTPITAIGFGQAANCAHQPVCCQENKLNGLINLGCTAVSA